MEQNTLKRPTFKFTQIPVEIALTKDLSAKAKGILLYFLTRPDGWQFFQSEIYTHFADGKDSIRSGLMELKHTGYLSITRVRNEKGEFIGWNYELLLDEDGNRIAENPKYGKSDFGKSATNNTNILNKTDNIKKEETHKEERTPKYYQEQASIIYNAYPRKAGKPVAIRAILKALKTVQFEDLLAKVDKYATLTQNWSKIDKNFIPYPSTWFNQERYNDDPATWERADNTKRTQRQAPVFDGSDNF